MDEQRERELIEKWLGGRPARFLRGDVFELVLHLPQSVATVRRLITNALRIEGGTPVPVLEDEIGAVLGGELGGLRPAVVSFAARQDAAGEGTEVRIRGMALEGLGKQRGGRRAVEVVADRLRLVSGLPS